MILFRIIIFVQELFPALSIVIVLISIKNVKLMMEIGMNSIMSVGIPSIPTNRSVDGRNTKSMVLLSAIYMLLMV